MRDARFAIDQFALSPSTPLAVQADYVASQLGACLAAFFLWLLAFLVGQTIERWFFLAILLVFVASTVKSARLYWKNRKRSMIGSQEENI